MTSGLQPSDLVIVAARPSMGKTSLVLNIAQHVGTKTDMTVGIFSLEMSKEQLFLRMLTAEARIDAHRLRGGFLGERDWGRLSQAIGTLSEAKIFIDDTPSIGVLEMRAKCRRLAAEHGLHLVIVDYIQLMQGRGRFENRTLELASISRSLKGLAKELSVPIVVLSQLEPRARVALRSPAAAVRPARIGRPRAGRRRRRLHLSRRCVHGQEPAADRGAGRGRDHHRQAAQRPDRRRRSSRSSASSRASKISRWAISDPSDRRARRSRGAHVQLHVHRRPPEAAQQQPGKPPGVIAVVKANAYGHGAPQVARALEAAGADLLACADIEEGAVLRAAGVQGGDSRLRRAERQRSRRTVRLRADADDFDAGRRARRAGRRGAVQAARAVSPEDRHRHEPARLPLRQPEAHAARAAGESEPRARRRLHALRDRGRSRLAAVRRAARAVRRRR